MAVIWSDLLDPANEWDKFIAVADAGLPLIAARVDNGFYVTNSPGVGTYQYAGRQVHAVAVSGSGNVVFAAVAGSGPAQLKKSTNGGTTWVDTAFLSGVGYDINSIAVTQNAEAVYLATSVGLYVTYDQGATATQLDSKPFTEVKVSGGSRIVALNTENLSVNSGIYIGQVISGTLHSDNNPFGPLGWRYFVNYDDVIHVDISADGEKTVALTNIGEVRTSSSSGASFVSHANIPQSQRNNIHLSDDGNIITAVGLSDIYISYDFGKTWSPSASPLVPNSSYMLPNASKLYLTGRGISPAFTSIIKVGTISAAPIEAIATFDGVIPMLRASPSIVADLTLPMLTLNAAAHASVDENAFDGIIPMLALEAYFGAAADELTLPMLQLDAQMTASALISVNLSIPMLKLDAAGTGSPYVATVDVSIPMLQLQANFGASASLILPALTLEAHVTTGGLLTVDVSIPMLRLDAQSTRQSYATFDLSIPMLVPVFGATADVMLPMLNLDAQITAVVTITYEAYAVNLNHDDKSVDAVTRYTNYPFTQIVRHQNSYYGVAADGLYLLEGTTDHAVPAPLPITWAFKSCLTDFKQQAKKTIVSAYFGGKLGPLATISLYVGEESQAYAYSTPRNDQLQNYRQVFGKGNKSRYYAIGATGAGVMALDGIEFNIATLSRRI